MAKKSLFVLYGISIYLVFFAVFLYLIGFVGNFLVPKTIDTGTSSNLILSIGVNLLLVSLFGLSHSIMARPSFKAWWTRIVPKEIERSTFVLVASITLIVLFLFWQPIETTIWDMTGTVFAPLMWVGFWAGWVIVLISTYLINHFDLFGLRQVYLVARDKAYTPVGFIVRGFYHFMRQPMMFGMLLAFWCIPMMTAGHLLFATAMTVYIFIGIHYEERDLEKELGTDYIAYKERTGMFVPNLAPTPPSDVVDVPAS
ncbi:MAG: methanethiol S-methyltransferase [Chloroflexota bacterium]